MLKIFRQNIDLFAENRNFDSKIEQFSIWLSKIRTQIQFVFNRMRMLFIFH